MDTSEKDFEAGIERVLMTGKTTFPPGAQGVADSRDPPMDAPGGWRRRSPRDHDMARGVDPEMVVGFVQASQPKAWQRFAAHHGTGAKERLLQRVVHQVEQRGVLEVLRNGIKLDGHEFRLAYFCPATHLDHEAWTRYELNLFSMIRQVHYSERNPSDSLDMVLYLNGLPLFTVELKNPLKGQVATDAIKQYRRDRNPKEPLFHFGRCLAHFAVDTDDVFVTTHLRGDDTRFIPWDRGFDGGAGNPPVATGYKTSYLWSELWTRARVLDLVRNYLQIVEEYDYRGERTGRRHLLFPRYHQLDTVQRLLDDARGQGAGQRYLIKHSAGSGKTNTLCWLAHRFVSLHDAADRRVFDAVIVVSDRRILDAQLQRTMQALEQTPGVVENIDENSRQLKEALDAGAQIIVTTIHKFDKILEDAPKLTDKRFGVIIDEAHSSQTGDHAMAVRKVLTSDDVVAGGDLEDQIAAAMEARARTKNVSFFAFTATPKEKTLQLFGTLKSGRWEPFSEYTMRQAIEEGYILDVLKNYVTYRSYWKLVKEGADDPRCDRERAQAELKIFVEMHPDAIAEKGRVMFEHFEHHVKHRIEGKARAMVVTSSRLHAVRYKLAFDRMTKAAGAPWSALVAFTGEVRDGGAAYTEASMNPGVSERLEWAFKDPRYRVLIVAEKFQTGFDEPMLQTMYVDKKLTDVAAVQTLSRLNRTAPAKDETFVLDFVNQSKEIAEAFQKHYDRAVLRRGTDPNTLYDVEARLYAHGLFSRAEVDAFAKVWFDAKSTQARVHALVDPICERYKAISADQRQEVRGELTRYESLYGFLSQVLPFADPSLEKLHLFASTLLRKLPLIGTRPPVDVQRLVQLQSYGVRKAGVQSFHLRKEITQLDPVGAQPQIDTMPSTDEVLSRIVRELNERYGLPLDETRATVENLLGGLVRNEGLRRSMTVNSTTNARLTFNTVLQDLLQGMVDSNVRFFRQFTDNDDFACFVADHMFHEYERRLKTTRDPRIVDRAGLLMIDTPLTPEAEAELDHRPDREERLARIDGGKL